MSILTTTVPLWVSLAYLIAIPACVFFIAKTIKKGAIYAGYETKTVSKVFWAIVLFYSVYLIYTSLMSFTGIFYMNSLPPKLLLFTTIPFLLILLIIVYNLNYFDRILKAIPLKSLVIVHSFRLIGLLLLTSSLYGAIPKEFAYPGAIGDVLITVSGIFVARALEKGKRYSKTLTFLWNCFGLADIILIMVSAVLLTQGAIATGTSGLLAINLFPLCLIPAFGPPTIIFLHICIFKKLLIEKEPDMSKERAFIGKV